MIPMRKAFGGVLLGLTLFGGAWWAQPGPQVAPERAGHSLYEVQDGAAGDDGTDFYVSEEVTPSISPAIIDLPIYVPEFTQDREINPHISRNGNPDFRVESGLDPLLALQEQAPAPDASLSFLNPILNFDGQGYTFVNPPDTVGDVGPNHYIQVINGSSGALVKIYDKSGNALAGPIAMDSLGTSNCANGLGDGIVLYDQPADRWMLSEFSSSGNRLCVYISATNDPVTTTWYGYNFAATNFPDYPKYAVWPDAYYVTTNENSPAAYALDRTKMLAGLAATYQRFTAPPLSGFGFQALTPADLDGATLPPAGSPGLMMRHRDTEAHGPAGMPNNDILETWAFHVDFANPANSTFTQLPDILVAEFSSDLCGFFTFSCIPQPGTNTKLDPLREVLMWRLQYRNFGAHETLVGNLATDVDGTDHAGVRWFELRNTGNGWFLEQEGTYAPDQHNRWMAAIAMDGDGNIAVGYNISSGSVFPGIRYAGRLAGDPPGTLPQSEGILINGSASNASNRYGDYSAMSVDPADDCTFWFTGEYNSSSQWKTRIGTFKFDTCGTQTQTLFSDRIQMKVRHAGTSVGARDYVVDQNSSPVDGALVDAQWTLPDSTVIPISGTTNALGRVQWSTPVVGSGTYTLDVLNITKAGYTFGGGVLTKSIVVP